MASERNERIFLVFSPGVVFYPHRHEKGDFEGKFKLSKGNASSENSIGVNTLEEVAKLVSDGWWVAMSESRPGALIKRYNKRSKGMTINGGTA